MSAQFVGASPNNDLHRGSTFLLVQRLKGSEWVTVADDGDFSTRFHWARVRCSTSGSGALSDRGVSVVLGRARRGRSAGSRITVEWSIPADVIAGTHRMLYFGDALSSDGVLTPISGETDAFDVVAG